MLRDGHLDVMFHLFLVEKKRQERFEVEKSKLKSYNDAEDDQILETSPVHVEKKKESRHYREAFEETPTHTGGLSREAKEKLTERLRKERERGVHASTVKHRDSKDSEYASGSKDRDRDKDRHRDRDRDRVREKDRDKRRDEYKSNKSNDFNCLVCISFD